MISNPQVGQRVRCISIDPYNGLDRRLLNQIGTIIAINYRTLTISSMSVQFDNSPPLWYCYLEHLEPLELTPEEQDQKQRQAYADKYL